ncbi:MAG: hemerythrin domain-containing protein [Labilithrix sp.]|nr:hemerythrin domain-containing protein [Labilithrix sp.]MCW5809503.1 hemerythrin domain-containing protein [Labilithrix sp.]
MSDPFVAYHEGLVAVHRALAEELRRLADVDTADVARAHGVGGFLLGHHHVESAIVFPGLRRHGRLRSTDVAFLDARDAEHVAVEAACRQLAAMSASASASAADIARLGAELLAMFEPHVAAEEDGLRPAVLRTMISREGLDAIGREVQAHHARRA